MGLPVTVTCVDTDSNGRMSSRSISVSGMEMSWMKTRPLVVEGDGEEWVEFAIRSSRVVFGAERGLGGWEWCWRSEGGHQRSISIIECAWPRRGGDPDLRAKES